MKVAVSIPDPIFAEADALADRLNISRSKLYARALSAYVVDNDPYRITERMNAVVHAIGEARDPAVLAQSRRILSQVEW